MGEKRNKQRINSKIDELPEDLHTKVDVMLADTSNSYERLQPTMPMPMMQSSSSPKQALTLPKEQPMTMELISDG